MNITRACLDRRAVATLAVAGLVVYLLAPDLTGRAIPLLILAACPLSMVAMVLTMQRTEATAATVEFVEPEAATVLERRLAALDPERAALVRRLAAAPSSEPAQRAPGGVSEGDMFTGANVALGSAQTSDHHQ